MTVEEAKSRWKGPVVPGLTIFNEDSSRDLEGLRGNIRYLLDAGRYQEAPEKITGFNATFRAFRAEMEVRTSGEAHAIKKIMGLVGLTGGPSRPPTHYIPMTDQQRATLSGLLREGISDPTN